MGSAVVFDDVAKRFRLYRQRHFSLKEAFLHGRRGVYDDFWVLRNLSFNVESGTTIGIIGANGSGKSTALKLIARILHPNAGKIAVEGRVSALLELGTGFHPEYTGRENVFLNGALLGLRRALIRSRLDEIVEFAGIEAFIDNPVKTYSPGMVMRLGFAIAVNVDPEILLIDEVLAVGDAEFAEKCFARVNDFRARGKTIVLVSHDLEAVRRFCDRAILIDQGGVRADGVPAEVTARYLADVRRRQEEGEGPMDTSPLGRAANGVRITRAEILDGTGRPQYTFQTGEPFQVQISYACRTPVQNAVFGVSITRSDGVYCYAANTRANGLTIPKLEGNGTVAFSVPQLNLLEGNYLLSSAITEERGTTYDQWDRRIEFTVRQTKSYAGGIVYMRDRWTLDGATVAPDQH